MQPVLTARLVNKPRSMETEPNALFSIAIHKLFLEWQIIFFYSRFIILFNFKFQFLLII